MRTVVAEGEYRTPTVGTTHHGLTIYLLGDGTYQMVARARSYDGVMVTSRWDSEPVALTATTLTDARAEANAQLRALVLALRG